MLILISAITLRILSNPLGNVVQKQLTQKGYSSLAVNFITYVLLGAGMVIYAFGVEWRSYPLSLWHYAALDGILGALGNACLIKALKQGDLSVLGPVNAYKSVVALLFAVIMLGEIPNFAAVSGIIFIIGGSYLTLGTLEERFSLKLLRRKDIQYRLLALLFTAIEAVVIKKVITLSSVWTAFALWCWFGALFSGLMLLAASRFNKQKLNLNACAVDWRKFLTLAAAMGVMQISTNIVFKRMDVAAALALFQLSILVSVVFGYRFFKEQHIGKRMLGAAIMLCGSALIIIFS